MKWQFLFLFLFSCVVWDLWPVSFDIYNSTENSRYGFSFTLLILLLFLLFAMCFFFHVVIFRSVCYCSMVFFMLCVYEIVQVVYKELSTFIMNLTHPVFLSLLAGMVCAHTLIVYKYIIVIETKPRQKNEKNKIN